MSSDKKIVKKTKQVTLTCGGVVEVRPLNRLEIDTIHSHVEWNDDKPHTVSAGMGWMARVAMESHSGTCPCDVATGEPVAFKRVNYKFKNDEVLLACSPAFYSTLTDDDILNIAKATQAGQVTEEEKKV